MKKFAITAAAATALTLTMGNAAFAQTTRQPSRQWCWLPVR